MRYSLRLAACLAVLSVVLPANAMAADIKGEVLAAHNALRAKHGVPPLSWSSSLAETAQAWADGCKFEHSSTGLGENLAQGTTGAYSPGSFVNDWYSEISSYDFTTGASTDGNDVGHFTQVVWKGTKQVGCGLTTCGENDLLVCNYSPAGNLDGAYQDNVLPPK